MYEDITIRCKDCGKEFTFTADEQAFFAEKGLQNMPKRCRECRRIKKESPKRHELYTVTCAKCGKEAHIPFEPKEDRPVYCSECFAAMRQHVTEQ
ncbi:MAG: zinc-ribbon domain containing protein [Clostridia bacterium]|nr:zinc-ribbon domain containing protein [Clostridia bacterium]